MYLAIDQATTSGIAYIDNEGTLITFEFTGTPNELFNVAFGLANIFRIKTILIEKMVHLRNTIPMRSLVERSGYLYYKFQENGFEVERIHSGTARKMLGFSKELNNKKKVLEYFKTNYTTNFTDNCSDACVLLLSKYSTVWREFPIKLIEPQKEKHKKK